MDQVETMHRVAGFDPHVVLAQFLYAAPPERKWLISGPNLVLMGWHGTVPVEHWFIWMLACTEGEPLSHLWRWMPYPLPYIAFARFTHPDRPPVFHETEKLFKKCSISLPSSSGSS